MKKGRKTERDKRGKSRLHPLLLSRVKYSAEILDGSDRANSAFYLKRPLEEKCRNLLEIKLSVCGERRLESAGVKAARKVACVFQDCQVLRRDKFR